MSNNIIKIYTKAPFHVRILSFGCDECGRRWKSAAGSVNDYQLCKNCFHKCYPRSYKYQAPNKKGNENRQTAIPHDSNLCGKCKRLGYSCMEVAYGDAQNDYMREVIGVDGEEILKGNEIDIFDYAVSLQEAKKAKKEGKKLLNKKKEKVEEDKKSWM
ncbi:MAG: hypothetical protein EXX96DRAFT_572573, partial [Benjaminiella poitrasii]